MVVALFGVAAGPAFAARYLGYNAANDNNTVVVHLNQSVVGSIYEPKVKKAVSDWNSVRRAYPGNWPGMGFDTATSQPATMNVKVYSEASNVLGYYDHVPGPTVDTLALNGRTLANEADTQKQKTVAHEVGHAGGAGHPDVSADYCTSTVMLQTAACPYNYAYEPFGAYDKDTVRLAPRYYSNDISDPAPIQDEFVEVKGKKVLASRTIKKKDGGFRVIEYDVEGEKEAEPVKLKEPSDK